MTTMPPVGSSRPVRPRPVCWVAALTSSVQVGVEKIALGRWMASVLFITNLAKELFSSSVPKFIPAVRDR
ncbi:hypothetical protein D3C80_2103690 [compost metagenome]